MLRTHGILEVQSDHYENQSAQDFCLASLVNESSASPESLRVCSLQAQKTLLVGVGGQLNQLYDVILIVTKHVVLDISKGQGSVKDVTL